MATHDVRLPAHQRPQFPDRCVGCEKPAPGRQATIAVTGARSTLGWTLDTALLAAGQPVQGTNVRVKVAVPCCEACARPLERRHFWKTVALYASGLLGAAACIGFIVWANGRGWSTNLSVVLAMVILLGVLALPVIYELKYPPAFTITPLQETLTYEFRSALCAREFACANESTTAPATAPAGS